MIGRCSKCKEHCEATEEVVDHEVLPYEHQGYWLSNCCGAQLIEDGERSHEE